MVGKFDSTLHMTNGKLFVTGTLENCAGGKVNIQAGVTQKGKVVSCDQTFDVTTSPFPWSMDVSAPFVAGTAAAASALATDKNGASQPFPWNKGDIAIA